MKVVCALELAEKNNLSLDENSKVHLTHKSELQQLSMTMRHDFIYGQFSNFVYTNFSIERDILHAHEECMIEGNLCKPEPMVVISYAMQGNVDNTVSAESPKSYIRRNQTATTLFRGDEKAKNHHIMPETTQSGHIYIPEKYLKTLSERHPDEVGLLMRKIESKQDNEVLVTGQDASPILANCLQSLFLPPILGNCSEDFMEQQIVDYITHITECDKLNKINWGQTSNQILVSKIHDALDILNRDFCKPLSLHSLALAVGTNECYLKAGFRHEFHLSVYAYLFEYRMKMAINYLLDTQKTIEEVSKLVGYEYAGHFITAFKRRFRITPLEFRLREHQSLII